MTDRPPERPEPINPPGADQTQPTGPASQDDTDWGDYTRPMQSRPGAPSEATARQRPPQQSPQQQAAPRPRQRVPSNTGAARYNAQPPVQAPAVPQPQQYPPRDPYAPLPPRSAQPPRPRDSGLYLPWWSLVFMIAIVGAIAFGLLLTIAELTQPRTPGNQSPQVLVITSQPTLSQDFLPNQSAPNPAAQPAFGTNPTAIPQALPSATVPLPTPFPSPSLPPGDFAIGSRVRVVGVDTSGLNVRSSPGLAGTPRFLAHDGDEFVLVEGPQNADDLEWWRIEDPDDPNRYGWAARNYLASGSQ